MGAPRSRRHEELLYRPRTAFAATKRQWRDEHADRSLPLLHVSATLDATATYNPKAGTVSIGGTITCSITANGQMFATLRQRHGRTVSVAQGYSDQIACGPTPTRFNATLLGTVTAGIATADWSVSAGRFGPPDQFDQMTGGPTTISITKR